MIQTKQNQEVNIESETGDIPTQAPAVRARYLLVRGCFRPQACCYAAESGPKDCMHETAFYNVKYVFLTYYKIKNKRKEMFKAQ